MTCLIFHKWAKVDAPVAAEIPRCDTCFNNRDAHKERKPFCFYALRVCKACGKAEVYGHGGRTESIPPQCGDAVKFLRGGA